MIFEDILSRHLIIILDFSSQPMREEFFSPACLPQKLERLDISRQKLSFILKKIEGRWSSDYIARFYTLAVRIAKIYWFWKIIQLYIL